MHGGVKLVGNEELSMALCFRSVAKKREFDPITNALVVNSEDMSSMKHHIATSFSKSNFEHNDMMSFQKQYQSFVKAKFQQWKWFADSA